MNSAKMFQLNSQLSFADVNTRKLYGDQLSPFIVVVTYRIEKAVVTNYAVHPLNSVTSF